MGNNAGVSRLVAVFDSHVRERTEQPDALELGTVQPGLALLLDRFLLIPAGDYLVCRGIAQAGTTPLQAGDRVLVAWVNSRADSGGQDPVIVDVVVTSGA